MMNKEWCKKILECNDKQIELCHLRARTWPNGPCPYYQVAEKAITLERERIMQGIRNQSLLCKDEKEWLESLVGERIKKEQ